MSDLKPSTKDVWVVLLVAMAMSAVASPSAPIAALFVVLCLWAAAGVLWGKE